MPDTILLRKGAYELMARWAQIGYLQFLGDRTSSCRQLRALVGDFQQGSIETAAFTILIKQ